jgi:hypothetical protein
MEYWKNEMMEIWKMEDRIQETGEKHQEASDVGISAFSVSRPIFPVLHHSIIPIVYPLINSVPFPLLVMAS